MDSPNKQPNCSSPLKHLFHSLLILGALLLCTTVKAQMYINFPVHYDFYRTESLDFDLTQRGPASSPTIGWIFLNRKSYELSTDIGLFYRKMTLQVEGTSYLYRFLGPSLSIQGHFKPNEHFKLGSGVSIATYALFQDPDYSVFLDPDDDNRLGKGYRSFDVGLFLEARYCVDENFSFGTKATFWFVPLLEFTPIEDYGEFGQKQRDLYSWRIEFSFRYQFLNK